MVKDEKRTTMFTSAFKAYTPDQISEILEKDGFFIIPSAIDTDYVDEACKELQWKIGFNTNDVGATYTKSQFFNNILTSSKMMYDIVTAEEILDICEAKFGSVFRLRLSRYYETYDSNKMRWHSDDISTPDPVTSSNSLIFMVYMGDTYDGELQLIRNSQLWKREGSYLGYEDKFIRDNHQDDIVTLSMPKGSLMLYDARVVHRAKSFENKRNYRQTILFHVDKGTRTSNKILANTAFMTTMNERLGMYLGFGMPSEAPYPVTSHLNLPMRELLKVQIAILTSILLTPVYKLSRILTDKHRRIIREFISSRTSKG